MFKTRAELALRLLDRMTKDPSKVVVISQVEPETLQSKFVVERGYIDHDWIPEQSAEHFSLAEAIIQLEAEVSKEEYK